MTNTEYDKPTGILNMIELCVSSAEEERAIYDNAFDSFFKLYTNHKWDKETRRLAWKCLQNLRGRYLSADQTLNQWRTLLKEYYKTYEIEQANLKSQSA